MPSPTPLAALIQTRMGQLGIDREALSFRLGSFQNPLKAAGRVNALIDGHITSQKSRRALGRLPEALEVDPDVVERAVAETEELFAEMRLRQEEGRRIAQEREDTEWRAAFRPDAVMNHDFQFANTTDPNCLHIPKVLTKIVADQKATRDQLADELGVSVEQLEIVLGAVDPEGVTGWVALEAEELEPWLAMEDRLGKVLTRYGVMPAEKCDSAGVPNTALTVCRQDQGGDDPFGESADDIAAEETSHKAALFAWSDSVLGLGEAELQLELDDAAKRFGRSRAALSRIVRARRSEKQGRSQPHADASEDEVRYYGTEFRVSTRGVFARRMDSDGTPFWDRISTTRMDIEALTRDARAENWGTYVVITNRDGGVKALAIPHALTAADKAAEIAALLASLGVGVVPSKLARQLIVQFLATEVKARITSVPQIGWQRSEGAWVFVLPNQTLVPSDFAGARPVLQTASLQTQHGLEPVGSVEGWINQIARPLAGNSNVHLCVGTAFAGPLLYWANEPPGFFHLWGTSKIAKSLAAAVGQSVWGRPKVPGEADAFGASWTATAVGLERYAVLRSDVGGSFDEIGEGDPRVIRAAVYVLANGSTKLRGTQEITLRPMESFRILGISTGEPTMMAFLSAGGEKVPAGLTVRLVDVPAEVRPESAFETCAVDQIEGLGKRFYPLTTQLHGAVGRAWLQHLVDLGPDQIQARLRTHREIWLTLPTIAALRATATGQVRSILNRFALVAAALRMGIEAGLLPWTYEDTDLGVAACIARWATNRAGRLDLAGEVVSAVERVREILAADLHGRFIHLQRNEDDGQLEYVSSDENKRDTLGFVKDGWILVEPTAWRSVLCAGFDPEKTARHLRHEGLLIADEGKLQKQERVLRGGAPAKGRFYALDMRILEEAAGTGPREVS